jgi:hypothetical protein
MTKIIGLCIVWMCPNSFEFNEAQKVCGVLRACIPPCISRKDFLKIIIICFPEQLQQKFVAMQPTG